MNIFNNDNHCKGLLLNKKFILFLLGFLFIYPLQAATTDFPLDAGVHAANVLQGITITGVVTDDNNDPLPGASVMVKGTNQGTTTGSNGSFTLQVPDANATIVISYIGFVTREIPVGNQRTLQVTLSEDTSQLDEVVVVGYGTQKKVNLTGAVEQVSSKVIENRAVTNVTQALVGAVPNLNIRLLDGKPTQSPSYNIRGTTSIGQGGGSALVLIDGVEGDPRMLNPNDVESISVLKDVASSSIYGARATFGVILITTKSPTKGKATITYSANFASKSPTTVPDYITDSYPWAQGFSDAWSRWQDNGNTPTAINKTMAFSPAYLAEIKRRWENPDLPRIEIDPVTREYQYFYSTDWYKELYKDNFFAQDHNISISGGNELASFYVAGRYNGLDGLYRYNSDTYAMYNLRAKGIIQVNKWLQVENNMDFSNMKYHQPYNVGEGSNIWRNIADEGHPLAPLTNPDGTLSFSSAYTVGDMYLGKSFGEFTQRSLKNKASATAEFFDKSLIIRADYTFQERDYEHQVIRTQVPYSRYEGSTGYTGANTNDFEENRKRWQYQAVNFYADYDKSFNQTHNIHLLVGYNYEQQAYKNLGLVRNGIVYEDVEDINLAVGDNISPSGGWDKWRIAGGFFRINYNFKERYLLEVNGRYDGSSKFPTNSQWAFFPSVSAGWRISQEDFWKVDPKAVSNLKIRASYGALGNGNIGSYYYTETYSIGLSERIIDGLRPRRTAQPGVVPKSLTWEQSTIGDIGLDVDALSYRLNFTGDVYRRWTDNMITTGPTKPAVFGATVPRGNFASLETTGFEMSISWNDRFVLASKPFHYNIRFTLSDYVAKITEFNNPEKRLSDYYVGQTIGEIWGYQVEGIFRSDEEVANSPSQSNILNHNTRRNYKGDLKFKNLDGDDVIYQGLNTVDDPGDRSIIGNSSPRFAYGITLCADWNRFFFSSFFQGVMKQDWYPSTESPFWGQYNRPYNDYPRWQENRQYREELENFDAYLPLLVGYTAQNGSGMLRLANDRYLQNVAYIRLRNLSVGYTLPAHIINKINAGLVRIYLSGENLWTWSPMYKITKDIDVANIYGSGSGRTNFDSNSAGTSGDGFNYPTLKAISLGLSITF